MASRADQKAQLRAEREAREQAQAAAKVKQQRLYMAGGVVVIAVVIAVVAIAISSGHGKTTNPADATSPASATAKASAARVSNLLSGIPQSSGIVLGNPNAPVTITEYGDLECSVCDDFALATTVNTSEGRPGSGVLDQVINGLVRTGKAKLVYKSLETATSDGVTPNEFVPQQAAAVAAGMQNKGWNYVELFYNEQGQEGTSYVNDAYPTGLAKQIPGLNLTQWRADMNSSAIKNQVAQDNTEGIRVDSGSASTPTVTVTGKSGQQQIVAQGIPTYAQVVAAVKSAA